MVEENNFHFHMLKKPEPRLLRSQCRRRVAFGTGVRQVNHSEAQGGQQKSMRLNQASPTMYSTCGEN